jgi:hypothetical protein
MGTSLSLIESFGIENKMVSLEFYSLLNTQSVNLSIKINFAFKGLKNFS